jgi:hypothetical protein
MKKYFIMLFVVLFFVGCSYKVDTSNLNISQDIANQEYNTYNKKEDMINTYFFKNKDDALHVSSFVTYIPFDVDGQLYSPFSSLKLTLDRYSNYQATTIKKVLEDSVEKNGFTKLFKNKDEMLIDNNLAFDLIREIRIYEERQQRDDKGEDGSGGIVIVP